jgi:hypothetical protein
VSFAPRNTWELEYISLRIPVEIINSARGGKVFSMHRERLQEFLGLSEGDTSRLSDCGLIIPRREMPSQKPKIDYEKLARSYRETMDRMQFVSHSDLARHLGVSRVWVSRVIKGIKRKVNG